MYQAHDAEGSGSTITAAYHVCSESRSFQSLIWSHGQRRRDRKLRDTVKALNRPAMRKRPYILNFNSRSYIYVNTLQHFTFYIEIYYKHWKRYK